MEEVRSGSRTDFSLHEDGPLRVGNRLYVPNDPDLKRKILDEAHHPMNAVHPGNTKMYHDL